MTPNQPNANRTESASSPEITLPDHNDAPKNDPANSDDESFSQGDESAMGMDDLTGSNGGLTQGDDYGPNSDTQRSGVSSGSNADGSSSGGRSQY